MRSLLLQALLALLWVAIIAVLAFGTDIKTSALWVMTCVPLVFAAYGTSRRDCCALSRFFRKRSNTA